MNKGYVFLVAKDLFIRYPTTQEKQVKNTEASRYPRQFTNTHPASTLAIDPTNLSPKEELSTSRLTGVQAREDADIVVQGMPKGREKGKSRRLPALSKESSAHFLSFRVQEGRIWWEKVSHAGDVRSTSLICSSHWAGHSSGWLTAPSRCFRTRDIIAW
jgi:hypothetical protein